MAQNKKKQPVREGLAFLIEEVMEKSEVVMNVKAIRDKLTDVAETIGTIQAKDMVSLYDSIVEAFGTEVAQRFSNMINEQFGGLMTSIQNAKAEIDNEIMRMEKGVEGGDMSDLAAAAEEPEAPPPAPEEPEEHGGNPEMPEPDMDGNIEDDRLGKPIGTANNFANRARKESARIRGKRISEDFLNNTPQPAIDQHPHKSANFAPNMHNLGIFHGSAGKLARNIEHLIDTSRLTETERKGLANVLSHFAAFCTDPSHWGDAETKLETALQSVNIWDANTPAIKPIVKELRKLAHLIAAKHEGLIESAIKQLKESSDPDALIVKTFRKKLAESKDAQMAAIRTARLFAIDIDDVVSVVKEACACQAKKGKKAVKEFKLNTPKSAKGMFNGKTTSELKSRQKRDRAEIAHAEEEGKGHKRTTKDLQRTNFAIRAHKSRGGKGWHHTVNEEELLQDIPMFPVNASSTQMQQPQQATPMVGGQNNNPSTRKPMTPADKRAQQQAQNAQQQGSAAMNTPPPPAGGQNMVTPNGQNMQNPQQPKMAPVQQVKKPQARPF